MLCQLKIVEKDAIEKEEMETVEVEEKDKEGNVVKTEQ
jgi:hypothetical protein